MPSSSHLRRPSLQPFSRYAYDSMVSFEFRAATAWDSFTSHARPRYWFSIVVHVVVVLMYLAMVLVWAFRAEPKRSFDIKHLAIYTPVLNFITM